MRHTHLFFEYVDALHLSSFLMISGVTFIFFVHGGSYVLQLFLSIFILLQFNNMISISFIKCSVEATVLRYTSIDHLLPLLNGCYKHKSIVSLLKIVKKVSKITVLRRPGINVFLSAIQTYEYTNKTMPQLHQMKFYNT